MTCLSAPGLSAAEPCLQPKALDSDFRAGVLCIFPQCLSHSQRSGSERHICVSIALGGEHGL